MLIASARSGRWLYD
ncbi:DUF1493 family protein [Salmonella enterica subsp. enterica serovar Chester]|nr:DUF1493 family protein [Salmonella enterica]